MSVPSFVREFLQAAPGRRVARFGIGKFGFSGTIISATTEENGLRKRIKYEVLTDDKRQAFVYADQVAHLT
jgi:hypothetical protein